MHNPVLKFILLLLCVYVITIKCEANQARQAPHPNDTRQVKKWLDLCESLRLNSAGAKDNYVKLEQAALQGLAITPADDAANRARFFFFSAFGSYYQVKFDSAQYYFYQSLREAQRGHIAELIANNCIALIPVNFQLRQQAKADSCKNILQSVLDTTHNRKILQDGYSGMGTYYQQKSYYSTAQDFLLKSIELRKVQVDTTSDGKLKADYAIQCYLLAKLYQNTEVPDRSLAILREGDRFSSFSPLVSARYLSSFTELYCHMGQIDSAMRYFGLLTDATKNSATVPSEMVAAGMNIANYFLDRRQAARALPYVTLADTLATKSKSPLLIYQAQMILGRYNTLSGNPAQAITLFGQSLPVAKQISRETYVDELKYMAEAQEAAGNMTAAADYYKQHSAQSDSLTKQKIATNFADQETRYETAQKELRITSLDKENKFNILALQSASRTRVLLTLGLSAVGVIALLLYFIYRNKERSNQLLNRQKGQLEVLNGQLEIANETKAKLFGIISHDLRSPVSRIAQLMQLQRQHPEMLDEEASQRHSAELRRATDNVLETMADLLMWSKSQMEHFAPFIHPTNVYDILKRETELLHQSIQDKDLNINNTVSQSFSQKTDENFVAVIIRNLLQNAIKYGVAGGNIEISGVDNRLQIKNTADRTTAAALNELLHNTQVSSKSSGLGLQLVADLARSVNVVVGFEQAENNMIAAIVAWPES
jgi:signal transduction histidine kinase